MVCGLNLDVVALAGIAVMILIACDKNCTGRSSNQLPRPSGAVPLNRHVFHGFRVDGRPGVAAPALHPWLQPVAPLGRRTRASH